MSENDKIASPRMKQGDRMLSFFFMACIRHFIYLCLTTLIIYSIFFVWSIKTRKELPSEKEYFQSNMNTVGLDPITSKKNLIGAARFEVEEIFGHADHIYWIYEQYEGITDFENEYRVKVVYLPYIGRVVWYETELLVG